MFSVQFVLEISLTWYAYPEQVRHAPLEPERAPTGTIRDAAGYREAVPDGRIGSNRALASVEHGQRLCEAAVDDAMERWVAITA